MNRLKKILENLKEEWAFQDVNNTDIFKNPDRKELVEITEDSNRVRLVLDNNTEDMYVWNARAPAPHYNVTSNLGYESEYADEVVLGQGDYERGEILMNDIDYLFGEKLENFENGEYDWAEKYHLDVDYVKKQIEDLSDDVYYKKLDSEEAVMY